MAASTGVASGSPRQTGMPSASLRQRTPNRPNHMSLSNLLNDEGPPQKLQRTGGDHDVWCSSSRNATANFESNGRYAPPTSPMGPPGVNTAGIQGVLNNNTPEPEKAAPVSGEKRAYVTGGPKIICDTCKESFTCDSLLRKHQAKHTKPFKCKEKGCERANSGFTSPNDLKRHENSVHKGTKGPATGFNCIYDHCRDRNKIYFRLDNFRNHLKKLHGTNEPTSMNNFLKQAESECRVEVNPEDVGTDRGSASETNTSVRSRKSVSFSRKSKKLQWVITRVDNGNLHRPRPAYYGPSEEESSDSAMDMDRSDMEITSPPAPGPLMNVLPMSPGVHNQEPMSPTQQEHNRQWTPVIPYEREEDTIARRKCMAEIQVRIMEMRSQFDVLQAQYDVLAAEDARIVEQQQQHVHVYQHVGGVDIPSKYQQQNVISPLNPKALEEWPVNNSETLGRFVRQSQTEDPPYFGLPSGDGGQKNGIPGRNNNNGRGSGPDTSGSMISPPETVASPPREAPPGIGPTVAQDFRATPGPSTPHPSCAPYQHLPQPQPVNRPPANPPVAAVRAVLSGPPEKAFRCGHPGCKSTFARNCELRKHRKRHTRPYGCTARFCLKQFGSKNDWKRHENSQHHRLESWKCSHPVPPYGPEDVCSAMHFRKENFINHLKSSLHNIKTEVEIKAWSEKSYIGGSDHHIFWCGFCVNDAGKQGRTIRLKNLGLTGWDERFDHLGSHFENGMSIRNYVYQDEDAIDCPSVSDSEDDDSPEPPDSPLHQLAHASIIHSWVGNHPDQEEPTMHATQSSSHIDNTGAHSKKLAWYCCQCVRSRNVPHPFLVDLHPSCLGCEHQRCSGCKQQILDAVLDRAL